MILIVMLLVVLTILNRNRIKFDVEVEQYLIGTEYLAEKRIFGDEVIICFSGIKEVYPFCPDNNKLYGFVYEINGLEETDKYTYNIDVLFQSSKYNDSCIEITYHQQNAAEKKFYKYSLFTDIEFTEFILICYDFLEEQKIDENRAIHEVDYRIITSIIDIKRFEYYFNNRNTIFSE